MFRIFCLAAIAMAAVLPARAASFQSAGCSSTEVQSAINAAASGDTVSLPAGCSVTWNQGVSIPNSKGITLNGNGATVVRGNLGDGAALVSLSPNASTSSRITGFSMSDSKSATGTFIDVGGGNESSAKFRIDNISFSGLRLLTHVRVGAPVYGVIDHNSFTWTGNNEVIHNEAYGAASTAGWSNDVVPGSGNALYIEDNTFKNITSGDPAYFWGGSAVQGYYGSRTVFRYNSVEMATVDMHGSPGMIGARWWEIYENTFYVVPNGDLDKAIGMRGGSGVIFNNRKTGRTNYKAGITLYEEDGGFPALYQIGRGKNQSADPAYVWGNDGSMAVDSGSSNVQAGRDFILGAKPGYSPYVYPHPLVSGAASAPAAPAPVGLAAPTNLRVVQ
jgi:hypothetical protein